MAYDATFDLEAWARRMQALLAELMTQDFRYEIDANELHPPAVSVPDDVPPVLRPLYQALDGLSMPDVHNGYFIHPVAWASDAAQRGLPTRIGDDPQLAIHVFGSDGGGGLFALGTGDGAVWHLPEEGGVEDGAFVGSGLTRARRIAEGLNDFLQLLERDVRAFVEGKEPHDYITDWASAANRPN